MNNALSLPVISLIVAISGCRHTAPVTGTAQPQAPIVYPVQRVTAPIALDGTLDETAWNAAAVLDFIVFKTHEPALRPTKGRILWDDTHLYVSFEAVDKDIWGYFKNRDDATCREDCSEVFFRTDLDKTPYYNFEINALETVYDAFSPKKTFAGNYYRWDRWDCDGLRVAVQIDGTLNNPKDVDTGWSMEIAIPFAELPSLNGSPPTPGDRWLFHLSRYNYSVYLTENGRELSSCAPLTLPFNDPTGWRTLEFVR